MYSIQDRIDPEWDSQAENGSSDLDPLNILIAEEEEAMTDQDTTRTPFDDDAPANFSVIEQPDKTIDEQIETATKAADAIEQTLLEIRAEGKEQWVISKSSSVEYVVKKKAEAKVIELQLDMQKTAQKLNKTNEHLRHLHMLKTLSKVAALELPTDDTPIGNRAAAVFLTSGINGVRRSLHYADTRKPKLEEMCERDKKRRPMAGQVYQDFDDQLADLNMQIEQLQLILEWAMRPTEIALAQMETNQFWNPSIQDPTQQNGTPVDNATPFD